MYTFVLIDSWYEIINVRNQFWSKELLRAISVLFEFQPNKIIIHEKVQYQIFAKN